MADYRIPGYLDASRGNRSVMDGTLARRPGVVPGHVGGADPGHTSAWDPLNYYYRAECLVEAARIGQAQAPMAILRETGHAIAELIEGLLPGLLMMLAVVGATTAIGGAAGAVVGGAAGFFGGAGVGAVPGAAAGAVTGGELGMSLGFTILTWLGLGFLIVAIGEGVVQLGGHVAHATVRAWNAHGHPQRRREIDAAGEEFATAVALLFKLVLTAIVARLTLRQGKAATEETLALLRKSKLGQGFAEWVAANQEALLRNPRLRPRPKVAQSEAPVQTAQTPSQVAKQPGQAQGSQSQSGASKSRKPRQPTKKNKNLDHSRTTKNPDGSTTYFDKQGRSVTYNKEGYPDFGPYSEANVKVQGLQGKFPPDDVLANKAAGLKSTPDGYTWHHVEDGTTMQLISTDIHATFPHTGGASILRAGI